MLRYPGMTVRSAALVGLIEAIAGRRPVEDLSLAEIRAARAAVHPRNAAAARILGRVDPTVGITYGTAPARDDWEIPLRIYRPRALRDSRTDIPVVLWFHGGGWVWGNPVNYDPICTFLAAAVECVVVSVDYRLAPEHRAPTAVHDAVDATTWIQASGDTLRADTSRLAVAGDSAGGNLAAVVAQVLCEAGMPPLRHQALVYPGTDMTKASPSIRQHAHAPILTEANIDAFRDHYVPAGMPYSDPLLSPLFGSLKGLPPALIQTADLDPIRDDGVRYAEALRGAGVRVRHTNYFGMPHGFASFPGIGRQGAEQRRELAAELRTHLAEH